MKKLFIAALIIVAAGTSAFAMDANKVDYQVKRNFEARFNGAQNVKWSAKDDFFKASFTYAEENVEAFFNQDGDLIGTSRKIDFERLPLSAIQKIKKEYASYKVAESIEFDQDGDRSYYVSLEDGNKQQILQVSLYGNVCVYKGAKK
ncbi:MAG: hypothetical protein V4450_00380 [Bacteroidota bacterium]